MILKNEKCNQRSEVGSRKSEVGSLMSDVRSLKPTIFRNPGKTGSSDIRLQTSDFFLPVICCLLLLSGCYSFKDVSIPPEVKTVRINYIENRARYINPQLSPQLTDKLRQKINNQTRLTQVQSDDAHYDIGGYISDYSITTSGISQQQAANNRLTVTVQIVFKNNLDPTKNFEAAVSRNFEFAASLSLQQAEAQLSETIIQNTVDEIFNRIFSNW